MLSFVFEDGNILLEQLDNGTFAVPYTIESTDCFLMVTDATTIQNNHQQPIATTYAVKSLKALLHHYQWIGLCRSYEVWTEDMYQLASKCYKMAYWDNQHQNNK